MEIQIDMPDDMTSIAEAARAGMYQNAVICHLVEQVEELQEQVEDLESALSYERETNGRAVDVIDFDYDEPEKYDGSDDLEKYDGSEVDETFDNGFPGIDEEENCTQSPEGVEDDNVAAIGAIVSRFQPGTMLTRTLEGVWLLRVADDEGYYEIKVLSKDLLTALTGIH